MPNHDPARVLKILKRLLRVTLANGAAPAEAEVATAAARRLLDKHGLTIEQVELLRDDPSAVVEESVDSNYRRQPNWYTGLAAAIADGFDCKSYGTLEGPVTFCGLASDCAVAAYLFRVLSRELPKAATLAAGRHCVFNVRRFKSDFLLGAVHRIGDRLEQSTKRPDRQGLIVLKQELINQHIPEMGTRQRRTTLGSRAAFELGQEHGDRVCLDGRPLPAASTADVPRLVSKGA